ncbi:MULTISPECIES: DeoR/GlpR family DNA-binding transcription regulator [Fusobacterium]|uniref:DeoR/GlpR family DNA-binding transcription regulator n=1 Tax=Fusobacterium TaxID=848 RepID=UPI001476D4BA|nr:MULTISPECIES: DeoR/GlpR family DNA-binding transcription regulator [Fusobacterium]NME35724.1 DeoR/GlpR transcriptional regulator [Fusobacterium sp. FSA-380-WT-3A]
MLANDRQNKIIEILERDGSVKVSNLVTLFDVSLETVRRDLDVLEKKGIAEKVYGGAILKDKENNTNLSYSFRETKNKDQKREIATMAIKYINEGETIALNGGTTNIEIAKLIKDKYNVLTVVTNSLKIVEELEDSKGINLILAGGIYNKSEFSFLGIQTEKFLNNFTVDKSFIAVGGVSLKRGITDYLIDEVVVQKKMIDISEEVIILADSSKIENNSLIKICDMEDINFIITDSNLDEEIKKLYLKKGMDIRNS